MVGVTLGLLALFVVRPQIDDERWVWWWPPKSLSKEERHGYTTQQIATTPLDTWMKRAKLPVDGTVVAYGYALGVENRKNARGLSKAERWRLAQVRAISFRYGMACIALKDDFDRTTLAIHAPRTLFAESEILNRNLMQGRTAPPVKKTDTNGADAIIAQCLLSKPSVTVDSKQLKSDTERVIRYRRSFERLRDQFPAKLRPHFDRFTTHWITQYFVR